MPTPLLIDTDPGIDDALALCLAFASPEFSVEALTTVAGNVPVERATRNVARVLSIVRPARVPLVARGAAKPLARPLVTATHVHGEDGLGDLDRRRAEDGAPRDPEPSLDLAPMDGADLILETARRHGEALRLVAIGPLTNLALALGRDPRALRGVGRVVVMGGAVAVPGNVTPAAEFNFYVDPHAAARVLQAGLPLTLVPLDVTRQVVWPRAAIESLAETADPVARFVRDLGVSGLELAGGVGEDGITLHDPLAVGAALDPTLVRSVPLAVTVETEGALTLGMSVADRRPGARRAEPTCEVALGVERDRFLDLFTERVCRRRGSP